MTGPGGRKRSHDSAERADSRVAPASAPEFSRTIDLSRVEERGVSREIEADRQEREALRARFDLEAMDSLNAAVRLERLEDEQIYRLEGDLRAAVTQLCVVTLEPVENVVEGRFRMTFVRAPEDGDDLGGADLGEDLEEDPPEPFSGRAIDVGEAVIQQFASMLDPYPRSPDAALDTTFEADDERKRQSPFAVLQDLRVAREPGVE